MACIASLSTQTSECRVFQKPAAHSLAPSLSIAIKRCVWNGAVPWFADRILAPRSIKSSAPPILPPLFPLSFSLILSSSFFFFFFFAFLSFFPCTSAVHSYFIHFFLVESSTLLYHSLSLRRVSLFVLSTLFRTEQLLRLPILPNNKTSTQHGFLQEDLLHGLDGLDSFGSSPSSEARHQW